MGAEGRTLFSRYWCRYYLQTLFRQGFYDHGWNTVSGSQYDKEKLLKQYFFYHIRGIASTAKDWNCWKSIEIKKKIYIKYFNNMYSLLRLAMPAIFIFFSTVVLHAQQPARMTLARSYTIRTDQKSVREKRWAHCRCRLAYQGKQSHWLTTNQSWNQPPAISDTAKVSFAGIICLCFIPIDSLLVRPSENRPKKTGRSHLVWKTTSPDLLRPASWSLAALIRLPSEPARPTGSCQWNNWRYKNKASGTR